MPVEKYNIDEVVEFGDQLMTDVFGSRRLNLTTYLVKAIDSKTEKWVTRFNRKLENFIFKKRVRKKYPDLYDERLALYQKERG
ncbi:MAG: hypothetical protein L6U99_10885 [Clostridium sp.]|nr:MAG: hypothetical protein L6U99_10885 [Clostridium sp.]